MRMLDKIIPFLIVVFAGPIAIAQNNNAVSATALADSMEVNAKPILILLPTDWCKYCSMQKAQLKNNQSFKTAKANFYYVELNAETKDSIRYNGKIFRYKAQGPTTGVHELAEILGRNKEGLSYPAWVLVDPDYQIIFRRNGILAPGELKIVLDAINELNLNNNVIN